MICKKNWSEHKATVAALIWCAVTVMSLWELWRWFTTSYCSKCNINRELLPLCVMCVISLWSRAVHLFAALYSRSWMTLLSEFYQHASEWWSMLCLSWNTTYIADDISYTSSDQSCSLHRGLSLPCTSSISSVTAMFCVLFRCLFLCLFLALLLLRGEWP